MANPDQAYHAGNELFRVDDNDLRLVNRILGLFAALLLIIVVVRVYRLEESRITPGTSALSGRFEAPRPTPFESEDVYLSRVEERDVFLSTREPVAGTSTPAEMTRTEVKRELTRVEGSIRVVGIAWPDPDLVMLEDRRQNKTYFLR